MAFATFVRRKHVVFAVILFVCLLCTLLTNSLHNAALRDFRRKSCVYSDNVDLRLIVMTYSRPLSLLKLLESLQTLELDGHSAALEIWIDRNRQTGAADEQSVKVASEFKWSGGQTRVHIHKAHVGIYGQWISTWRPRNDSDDELALFLEDDLSVSKYAYRWMHAVFRFYGHRTDFAGASLAGYQFKTLSARPKRRLAGPKNHTVMMYKYFSTWGFAPKPYHWRQFQVRKAFLYRGVGLYRQVVYM